MGTKTRSTFPVKDADFSSEKRIPKHGDENIRDAVTFGYLYR